MKTKDLIKRLQEADPSGEVECCVGNLDIYFVEDLPSYYDGALQVLVHDESIRDKCWSVIGGKLIRTGQRKIQIHTLSIEDALFDDVGNGGDFPVDIQGDSQDGHLQKLVDGWKEEAKRIYREIEEK